MFAANVFDHVLDSNHWHFFENLDIGFHLWPPFITRYMVLMVIAALIIMAIYIPLARRARSSDVPTGAFWNFFETLLTFIRDNIARPYIGHHDDHGHAEEGHGESHDKGHAKHAADPREGHVTNMDHGYAKAPAGEVASAAAGTLSVHHAAAHVDEADKYVPFLWTLFLFILVCNLLGLVPFGGSPTGDFSVTVALAIVAFIGIHGSAIAKMGFGGYMKSQIPNLDLPLPIKIFVLGLLVPIEFLSHFIKAFVLAVRLFANVFAGHMVLAVLMLFIVAVRNAIPALFWGVTGVTVFGVVALSMLELFVAFLQAYIFTFLTALFMGTALNPDH